ncbi:MAG: hypothetical protein H6713_38370 [Myxococcales bacterium]|nr:hypothetical protein [Myxococcales bacterium]
MRAPGADARRRDRRERARERCAALREAAERWRGGLDRWCAAQRPETEGARERSTSALPGVYVHRTRVYHGEQPRHFTGGLELPASRVGAPR